MTKLEVIHEIMKHHIGESRAVTSAKLCRELGLIEDDTHYGTRQLLNLCRETYRVPLVASNRGYYLAANKREIEAYRDSLQKRINGIQKTIDLLEEVG